MRRLTALILLAAMVLALSACKKQEKPGVTYPAEEAAAPVVLRTSSLSEDEKGRLLTEEAFYSQVLSFDLAQEADAIKIILFKLENGSWEDLAGGSWEKLSGDSWDSRGSRSGKLLIQFDALWDSCSVKTDGMGNTLRGQDDPEGVFSSLNSDAALLDSVTEAQWEELIPVAVQAVSHQDRVYAPDLDIWNHPEAYESQGYEAVYLVALAFRQAADSSPEGTFS